MPFDGYPLDQDHTNDKPMRDEHPDDHNKLAGAVNFLQDQLDDLDFAGAVASVNGETGVVVLDAADVGALPDTLTPLALVDGTILRVPARALGSIPANPPSGFVDIYAIEEADGSQSGHMLNANGSDTIITPAYASLSSSAGGNTSVSTTTLTTVHTIPITAIDASYKIDYDFGYEAGVTGKIKMKFTLPANGSIRWTMYGKGETCSRNVGADQAVLDGAGAGVLLGGHVKGVFWTNGTPSGNLIVQVAENTTDATPTIYQARSRLTLHREG